MKEKRGQFGKARHVRGPLIGYAIKVRNRLLGVECIGSPREMMEEMRSRGLDLRMVLTHADTVIDTVEIFKTAPRLRFSGGPHAGSILELLEALDEPTLARVARILERDPDAMRANDERAVLPLLKAVWLGRRDAVELLLRRKSAVDQPSQFDMTPLHWAAALGETAIVVDLLDAGANGRRLSWFFVTPGELAFLNKHRDTEKALAESEGRETPPFSIERVLERAVVAASEKERGRA